MNPETRHVLKVRRYLYLQDIEHLMDSISKQEMNIKVNTTKRNRLIRMVEKINEDLKEDLKNDK